MSVPVACLVSLLYAIHMHSFAFIASKSENQGLISSSHFSSLCLWRQQQHHRTGFVSSFIWFYNWLSCPPETIASLSLLLMIRSHLKKIFRVNDQPKNPSQASSSTASSSGPKQQQQEQPQAHHPLKEPSVPSFRRNNNMMSQMGSGMNPKSLVLKTNPITEDYTVTDKSLGLGINGKVVECYSRTTGQKFALKVSNEW